MKGKLKNRLSKYFPIEELNHICSSYEIIGDIAIMKLTETFRHNSKIIAETIMDIHKNLKSVFLQISQVSGDFRLKRLEFIAGKDEITTIHKEMGCLFSVNLKKCYFSPRLSYERMRIAKQVKNDEIIVNMFAGVGCFSIIIAKHSKVKKIYSIDINSVAIKFMKDNVRLNRLFDKVIPMEGDSKIIIKKNLCNLADRVLMPLPEKAIEYLPYAVLTLRMARGFIHYYGFEYAKKYENPIKKVKLKLANKLNSLCEDFNFDFGKVVRKIGPNWHQIVLDISVKQ